MYIRKILFIVSILSISTLCQTSLEITKQFSVNSTKDTLIFQIAGIAVSEDGEIYISDKIDYSIKKFDKNGQLKKRIGRRGKGPYEFITGPSDICYDKVNERIAVVDETMPIVKIFSANLSYIKTLIVPSAIADIDFDSNGNLIVCTLPIHPKLASIFIYNDNYEMINSFSPKNLLGNPLFDAFYLTYNKVTWHILLMYKFRNLIQIYDSEGNLIREITIKSLPERSEVYDNKKLTRQSIPSKDMFWDIDTDSSGRIYVLGGEYSNNDRKDIYILSEDGEHINTLTLKYKTTIFTLDRKSNIYVAENSNIILSKYNLTNEE